MEKIIDKLKEAEKIVIITGRELHIIKDALEFAHENCKYWWAKKEAFDLVMKIIKINNK